MKQKTLPKQQTQKQRTTKAPIQELSDEQLMGLCCGNTCADCICSCDCAGSLRSF